MTDNICKHCEHYKRSFPLFWLRYCEYGEPYFLKIHSRFCFSFSPKLEQLKGWENKDGRNSNED